MAMLEGFDRERVIERGHAFYGALDDRDWARAEAFFAPNVMLNMAVASGGKPEPMTPDAILAGWRTSLDLPDGLHHHVGNQRVAFRPGGADLHCSVVSIHYYEGMPPRTKMFVGNYTLGFALHPGDDDAGLLIEAFSYRHSFKIDAGTFSGGMLG